MGDYLKDMFIEVRENTQEDDNDILDMVYNTIVESSSKPVVTEMAADRAKEFVLSLPKFVPTEAWGKPDSMERQQITKLFNAIGGGRTVEGKLQFLQRIVDPNSKITSPRRIISSIIILESLKAVISSFNASSAGFVFEGWLAALLQGTQEDEISAKGNLPIQDLIAFEGTDKAVPISLKLLGPKTIVEGSFTNLVDGLDEFKKMVYVVARKDKETGGMIIEKFTFDQENFMTALVTTAKGGMKNTDLLKIRGMDLSTEDSIKHIMSKKTWPERYELLQQTQGYSQNVRKKKIAAQADQQPQQEPEPQQDSEPQPEEQPINESGRGDGGYQWGLSVPQLRSGVLKQMLNLTVLGELPYSEKRIVEIAKIHMDKLNEEIVELFTATKALSENINRYFLVEKRSTAINSGNKAIQDSIQIQKTLQADIQQSNDKEKA
jgi:hypothetical protein